MWKYALLVPFSLVLGLGSVLAGGDEAARIAAVIRPTDDFTAAEQYESRSAGAATLMRAPTVDAFSEPSANMSFDRELNFSVGNGIFRKMWVSSPASTASSDGLGPLFNARACQSCHLKDGRGHPPAPGDGPGGSMLVRLSVPPATAAERAALADRRLLSIPEPIYGGQFQDLAIQGHSGEGRLVIEYDEFPVELSDGTIVHLRHPAYSFEDLAYGPMHPDVMTSARVAPPMIGLGLLEAVDEADILAHADPEDSDGDGISGRPNRVWDVEAEAVALGRFGWKAGEPSIRQQAAHAFSGDMGLSTMMAPAAFGDCTAAQPDCRAAIDGVQPQYGEAEVPDEMFDLVVFYSRNLAVPMRRDIDDPLVLEGKELFYEAGCIGCHVPKYVTRRDETRPEQSFQLIWPYTDMLLHDMGEGLADHRPDGVATGREWRTPPLWGIGLTETVNGHTLFLHDGRARNLLEAILWHGGEAQAARDRVVAMDAGERRALLAFLNSL